MGAASLGRPRLRVLTFLSAIPAALAAGANAHARVAEG